MSTELRCLAGAACRNSADRDGQRVGATTVAANTLCDACLKYFTNAVHQLPRHWENLRDALGERAPADGEYVKSTPTPAIPISIGRDSLMVTITELATRAATQVAAALDTDVPTGRRPTPRVYHAGQEVLMKAGTPAWNAETRSQPHDLDAIEAAVALVDPHLELLAAAPPHPTVVWLQPSRCPQHTQQVQQAEVWLTAAKDSRNAQQITEAENRIKAAWSAAAACYDCCGWSADGLSQATEIREISGLATLLAIAEAHNKVRAELGKTRLRHKYSMPCPLCGGQVGREDGTTIVDCIDCDASWTEREYKLLAGMVIDERNTMETLKWLLAEAYHRLDALRAGAEEIRKDPSLDAPGSGSYILQGIDIVLAGHPIPDERRVATDRDTALERQLGDDRWTGNTERAYVPPKPKPKRTPNTAAPQYRQSSRSTLVDDPTYTADVAPRRRDRRCPDCNMIHAGDCA